MSEENEFFEFDITGEHAGQRIDSVLSLLLEDYSRSFIQKLIESGNVTVDGRCASSKKEKLTQGSFVRIELPKAVPCDALPEDIPLDIVYEDDQLIVVNKPKGMVVHPAAGNYTGTLVNGLLYHCIQNGESGLSEINGTQRPGIVHRIDKDTSGLLVVAKTDIAHASLSRQLAEHSVTRMYRALCFYGFKDDEGRICANIGRDSKNRLRMAVTDAGKGRNAVTNWRVLNRYDGFTEIECRLETGRTHQIRVHMAYINRPIVGDMVYGPSRQPFDTQGQMLHAQTLGFVHPASGEYMEFSADVPEIYKKTIDKIIRKTEKS